MVDLLEQHTQLKEDYDTLLEQLKWSHAIVSILVENEGGLVYINRETLEDYDLRGSVKVSDDVADDRYVIEVIPPTIDGEVV